jgi:hypothetical protein
VTSPKKSKLKDTTKGDSSKSKYFEVPKNDVLKMFGTTPIKRVEQPKKEVSPFLEINCLMNISYIKSYIFIFFPAQKGSNQ